MSNRCSTDVKKGGIKMNKDKIITYLIYGIGTVLLIMLIYKLNTNFGFLLFWQIFINLVIVIPLITYIFQMVKDIKEVKG